MSEENAWLDVLLHAASQETDSGSLISALHADLLDTLSQPKDMETLLKLIARDLESVMATAHTTDPADLVDALTSAQIDLKAVIMALTRDNPAGSNLLLE